MEDGSWHGCALAVMREQRCAGGNTIAAAQRECQCSASVTKDRSEPEMRHQPPSERFWGGIPSVGILW